MLADMTRSARFDDGITRSSFLAAFAFALVASGSVLCERLAHGRSAIAWLSSAAVTGAAILVVLSANTPAAATAHRLPRMPSLVRAHLFGVTIALALVHLGIALLARGNRLIERPAQFVNDIVLVVSTLCFVWSFVFRASLMRSLLPLASFVLLAAYGASMATWHVDPFPGLRVQQFVLQQVISTSAALLVFFFVGGE